jgi:hypothetical protein
MALETGLQTVVAYKKHTTAGVIPSNTSWKQLERVTIPQDARTSQYASRAQTAHQQMVGVSHGISDFPLNLNGELTPGQYNDFVATLLRRAWSTGATTGALTNITSAITVSPAGTWTRAAGSFLTDGFKVGDIVRPSGWTSGGSTAMNGKNYRITALTATVMTVTGLQGATVVAQASGDTVTTAVHGKKTFMPTTGHLDEAYAFEFWAPNAVVSERYLDQKPISMSIEMPTTDMLTFSMPFQGLSRSRDVTQYASGPTAPPNSPRLSSGNFSLLLNGATVAAITGLRFQIGGGLDTDLAVAGSRFRPKITQGMMGVSGEITAFFDGAALGTLFDNETRVALMCTWFSDNTATADFINLVIPRLALFGDSKSNDPTRVVQTVPFTAEFNASGGSGVNSEQTTISMQDSLAP